MQEHNEEECFVLHPKLFEEGKKEESKEEKDKKADTEIIPNKEVDKDNKKDTEFQEPRQRMVEVEIRGNTGEGGICSEMGSKTKKRSDNGGEQIPGFGGRQG